jgi:hypothetical protein
MLMGYMLSLRLESGIHAVFKSQIIIAHDEASIPTPVFQKRYKSLPAMPGYPFYLVLLNSLVYKTRRSVRILSLVSLVPSEKAFGRPDGFVSSFPTKANRNMYL